MATPSPDERKFDQLAQNIKTLNLTPRRSERKRSISQLYQSEESHPESPQKKTKSTIVITEKNIEKFYRNQSKYRKAKQELETIYEDPLKNEDGKVMLTGLRKIKRSITFPTAFSIVTKQKKLFRSKKVKRLGLSLNKHKKLTKKEFERRLNSIEISADSELSNVPNWCAAS